MDDLIVSFHSDLISDVKTDISEFGEEYEIAIWIRTVEGHDIITNYDFINEDDPINQSECKEGERIAYITLGELLYNLEEQAKIIR